MHELWHIEMLGGLRATSGEQLVTRFRSRRAGLLLAYLAYHSQQAHSRELLIEQFWPESEARAGQTNLRVALLSLRRQLEPPGVPPGTVLLINRNSVQLSPEACTTDVAAFQATLQAAGKA